MQSDKKLKIIICMGSSCFARGNNQNLDYIEKLIRENSLQAEVELSGNRCEKNCLSGPNIIINDIIYNKITKNELIKILSAYTPVKIN